MLCCLCDYIFTVNKLISNQSSLIEVRFHGWLFSWISQCTAEGIVASCINQHIPVLWFFILFLLFYMNKASSVCFVNDRVKFGINLIFFNGWNYFLKVLVFIKYDLTCNWMVFWKMRKREQFSCGIHLMCFMYWDVCWTLDITWGF